MHASGRRLQVPGLCSLLVLTAACVGGETEFEVGEWIQMGPFTFTVGSATVQYVDYEAVNPSRRGIRVELRVDLERSEPSKVKFNDFLNGTAPDRLLASPTMKVVDAEGHEFDGWVQRVSGKDRWWASFELIDHRRGLPSAEQFKNLKASDLQLRIRNKDRRPAQPATAVIQLE